MKKKFTIPSGSFLPIFSLLIIFIINSCAIKNVGYFADLPNDSLRIVKQAAGFNEPIIQPDDILNITVQTIDPANATVSAQSITELSTHGASTQSISGFLVDKNGFINIPLIGQIEVNGLTTYDARERIAALAKQYYKNPTVQVRFANYKITVLGEVARPATYTVPNEKITVLDALGLAGDLTIYGKRENVLLIREQNGQKEMIRLNLYSSDIFQSPYFYLRQNDVLYVEPGKAKAATNNAARTQTLALVTAFISVLVIVLTRL